MIEVFSLKSRLSCLDMVFDHIDRIWNSREGTTDIRPFLNEKVPLIESETIKGVVVYKEGRLAGVAWVDLAGLCYGSVMFHHLESGVEKDLVAALVNRGLLDDILVELLVFWDEPS